MVDQAPEPVTVPETELIQSGKIILFFVFR